MKRVSSLDVSMKSSLPITSAEKDKRDKEYIKDIQKEID